MKKLLITLVLITSTTIAHGESSNPGFEAICKDVNTHGYRDTTDLNGKKMEESWTTTEKFGSQWRFKFTPPGQVQIDGKPARILAQNPGIIIVMENPGNNGYSASVWTYAIHIGMQKVVGSQVNAFGVLDTGNLGVKARSTNFDCGFEIN